MVKVKNAIILAAGRGSRINELTKHTPKPLLKFNNKVIIEVIIENLHAKNINNIIVVTGYLSHKFNFLKEKYGVKLVHNENWDKGNNAFSIKAVLKKMGNSLVINGDTIMRKNIFKTEYLSTITYVEKNKNIDEWFVDINDEMPSQVINFIKENQGQIGYYQKEILFITNDVVNEMKKNINLFPINEYYEFLVLLSAKNINAKFGIEIIKQNEIFDLDTMDDLK